MRIQHLLYFFLIFVMLLASCRKDSDVALAPELKKVADFDYSIVKEWDELFLEIERYASGYRPGPAPRALAYIGLATYEACVSGMPEYKSLAHLYPSLEMPEIEADKEYHWPTVVNGVRTYMMPRFFSTVSPNLFSKIATLGASNDAEYSDEVDAEVFRRSKAYGAAVGDAFWKWSETDPVGHDAYTDPFKDYDWKEKYKGPGDWVATFPGPGRPMFPHWGKARTFAISETDKLSPPPLPYSESKSSPLYAQALEVYAQTVNAPYENIWIAEFWSDDLLNLTFSPGSRWIAIALQVYENENVTLETAIYCDAKVGMALNDAAVASWHSKYFYNVERPITYINRLIDPNWETPLFNPLTKEKSITPSFPAYPSGHSTMGAAAAEALTSVFGIAYGMADRCHETRTEFEGKPRTFHNFYEMAEENAWSRIPLGVHFRMDSEQGVNLGYRCGRRVNALAWE